MKQLMENCFVGTIVCFMVYIVGVFIVQESDVSLWTREERISAVVGVFCLNIIYALAKILGDLK